MCTGEVLKTVTVRSLCAPSPHAHRPLLTRTLLYEPDSRAGMPTEHVKSASRSHTGGNLAQGQRLSAESTTDEVRVWEL